MRNQKKALTQEQHQTTHPEIFDRFEVEAKKISMMVHTRSATMRAMAARNGRGGRVAVIEIDMATEIESQCDQTER